MTNRSVLVDVVRGIAIIQVIVWHVFTPQITRAIPEAMMLLRETWSGVDLFLVLSGFLIGGKLIRNRGDENYFSTFYARCVLRILPLYVAAVLLFLYLRPGTEPIWPLATFTQNFYWMAENRFGNPVIGVTWSLAVEEQFYLLVPFLIWKLAPKALPFYLAGLIVLAPFIRSVLYATLQHSFLAAYLLLPCRMDALLLGVMIAWVVQNKDAMAWFAARRTAVKVTTGVLVAGFVAMSIAGISVNHPLMTTVGYTWIAAAYASLFFLALTSLRKVPTALRVFKFPGLACYSLYLFHIPAFALMGLFLWPSNYTYVALLTVIGAVSYLAVEKPLMDFGHRRFKYGNFAGSQGVITGNA